FAASLIRRDSVGTCAPIFVSFAVQLTIGQGVRYSSDLNEWQWWNRISGNGARIAKNSVQWKGLYGWAARYYADAFAGRAALASGNRQDAACAAARAGYGPDAPELDERARAVCRKQAVDWLRAELDLMTELKKTPQGRTRVEQILQGWLKDPDLAGLRDPAAG